MNKKKVKVSFKAKVMMGALIPLVFAIVILNVYVLHSMRVGMEDEVLTGLEELCYSVSASYDAISDGDFSLEGENLMKGSYDVTENENVIDSIVANSETDITFFFEDTRRATSLKDAKSGERILGTKASDEVIETTLKGGEVYETTDITVNEKAYYAVYIPVKGQSGSTVGMIFAGKPSESVDSVINKKIQICTAMGVFLALIAAAIVIVVVTRIGTAIKKTNEAVVRVADGALDLQFDKRLLMRGDELGVMFNSMHTLSEKLKTVVGNVQNISNTLLESGDDLKDFSSSTSNATDEISRAVEDMSQGSISQAEDVETATIQVGEMGSSIEKMVKDIESLYANSEQMEKSKTEAETIVGELAASSDHTYNAVKRIEKQVKLTDESVTQIQQAVALITSIAEETNLLSLNASIEAARAGEAGKGFAVVASQIQKLAEESNNSAASIADVIENLSNESRNTVEAMNNMHDIIIDQQQKLGDTEIKFNEVSTGIQNSLEQINEIRESSEVCDGARIKVTDIIQNLSAISEENAAATEETSASMQELNSTMTILAEKADQLGNLASQLNNDLSFFKL